MAVDLGSTQQKMIAGPSWTLQDPLRPLSAPRERGKGTKVKINLWAPGLLPHLGLSSWNCVGGRKGSLGQMWGLMLGPVNVIQTATSSTLSCPELTAPEAGVGGGGLYPLAPDCGQLSFKAEMEWGRGKKYP